MSDEKKGGKVIFTSTPNLHSDRWLDDAYLKSLQRDPETFRKEYMGTWNPDPSDKAVTSLKAVADSMSKTADVFRGFSGAMTSAAASTPTKKVTKADLDKTIADMKAALNPERELRGRDRIREALRQREIEKGATGQPTPRREPNPPSEIDRGSEWGSW